MRVTSHEHVDVSNARIHLLSDPGEIEHFVDEDKNEL